ncbi:DeoR/GlpR family DNA-binding transcription regulator [Vibrio alginolyticus]|nr:DeoR/GlpR transcriptional regulator [Vibrio alginolyticus]
MTQEERLVALRAKLEQQNKVTLSEVCEYFGISRDSARRDLVKLSQQPGLQRIRGGVMLAPISSHTEAYASRPVSDVKHRLAQAAAALLDERDHLVIDTSTILSLLPLYAGKARCGENKLNVVTNSIDVLTAAETNDTMDVYFLGGHFDPYARAVLGAQAEQQMQHYHVNKAFIGVCALTSRGLTTNSLLEATMKQAMIAQAQQVIVVCESRKIGSDNFHHVCDLSKIDIIITDHPPQSDFQQLLDHNDIECIVVSPK